MATAPKTKTSKRSISFNQTVKVRKTRHIKAYTNDEIYACWYTDHDFQVMKHSVKVGAKFCDKGLIDRNDQAHEFPARGLENFTKKGKEQKIKNKRLARDAVLDEQDRQRAKGIVDEEAIKRAYQGVSIVCQLAAHSTAVQDRVDIS